MAADFLSPARLARRLRSWLGEPGTPRRVLVRNGLWESTSYAAYAVVMFFLSPFIVHGLGDSTYGIWEMVISLTGFLGIADLGVRPAAVHFVAQHDARKDHEALNRFVNSAFLTFAAAGLVILLAAGPLAYLLPRFWRLGEGPGNEAALAVIIVAGGLALSLPFNAFSAVMVGKQRFDVLGRIRLVMLAVRTTLIVVVLSHGLGLIALALVVAGSDLLQMFAFSVAVFRLEPGLRLSPRLASREAVVKLLKFGGWATAVIVALQVIWATDALVIGRAIDAASVAFFAIGFKLAFYARDLLRVVSRVIEPASGQLFGLGDREGIRRLLTRSVRVMLLIAGPMLVYLLAVGKPFLHQWMGASYARDSYPVLVIMTFAVLPAIASAPLASVHYGTGRVRPLALLVGLEALLNLGLSVILVGPYGIAGVAVGTAVPAFLIHAVLLPLGMCRHYGIGYAGFLVRTGVAPLAAGGLTWLVLSSLVDPEGAYGWPALFGLAALSVVVYAASTLLLRLFAKPLLVEDAS